MEKEMMEDKMMWDRFMSQKMDWKKIWLLFWKQAWMVLVLTVLAAILAGGIYRIYRSITSQGQRYVVSSDYYITFNEDENGVDHFNAYTWDTMLRYDPLVEGALAVLPKDYTEEEILASVTGKMLGDYRILTVYVTHADPQRAQTIATAYKTSLELFADKLTEFHKIEMWSQDECKPVVEADLTVNAAGLGAVIGFVLALILFAVLYVLDDSIYVERDFVELERNFAERMKVPFLGTLTKAESEVCKQELQDNLSYLLPEKEGYYLVHASSAKVLPKEAVAILRDMYNGIVGALSLQGEDLNVLRNSSGVIVMIPWGSKNGSVIEKTMQFLNKHNCKIAGAVVYNAEDGFLRKYYNLKRS